MFLLLCELVLLLYCRDPAGVEIEVASAIPEITVDIRAYADLIADV
jgi:hypothetical protein